MYPFRTRIQSSQSIKGSKSGIHWTRVLQYSCQELSINGERQTVQRQVLERVRGWCLCCWLKARSGTLKSKCTSAAVLLVLRPLPGRCLTSTCTQRGKQATTDQSVPRPSALAQMRMWGWGDLYLHHLLSHKWGCGVDQISINTMCSPTSEDLGLSRFLTRSDLF